MKTAVSLPDDLFEQAERAAATLGLNRSQLYAHALAKYLLDLGPDPVTERLNETADELAGEHSAGESSHFARRLIDTGRWEW